MNHIANRLISFLVLLCLSATVIPLNILHDHKEVSHCDITNVAFENDPCHLSSYHANTVQKLHCEHKSHVNKKQVECEFCKIVTSQRRAYIQSRHYSIVPISNTNEPLTFDDFFFLSSIPSVIFSRGPPA